MWVAQYPLAASIACLWIAAGVAVVLFLNAEID
jgi:hypothetical protein